jgi:hypothetical protein
VTETRTAFFVVDVETTGLDPVSDYLLTIGVVPVLHRTDGEAVLGPKYFYALVEQPYIKSMDWYRKLHDPESTMSWWLRQNLPAQNDAWRDLSLDRTSVTDAWRGLVDFVLDVAGPLPQKQRVLAANPVSFDAPWVEALHRQALQVAGDPKWVPDSPFSHQTLCLRSMMFGQNVTAGWGGPGRTHQSLVPHQALEDALAQAQDLISLLRRESEVPDVRLFDADRGDQRDSSAPRRVVEGQ